MEHQGQFTASEMINSLNSWWELAGVDSAVGEEAVDWFALDAKPDVTEKPLTPPIITDKVLATTPIQALLEWPSDIETLKAMISSGAALPGNSFATRFIAPVGPAASEVMIVSDLPDSDEGAAGTLGSGATGMLLSRMLAAIGIELADCYWTALATTIPPTGEVPEAALGELDDFVRHQITLVDPKSLILLGSSACKALLNEDLMVARKSLGKLNHEGGNKAVLTTFHPRTLIARPQMKGQAWKDLQMFAKRDVL